MRKQLTGWAADVWLSCGQLNFQFSQLLQKPGFYLKPISLLHLRCIWQLLQFSKKTHSLSDLLHSRVWVLLLTSTWDVPDCESAIVKPVMSGESASSCSAICPRPGSLIREESCGKVCVSLPHVPLSLQLFVRLGPRQQHQRAGDQYIAAGMWSEHRCCGGRKGGKMEPVQDNKRQTPTNILWG